MTEKIFKFFKKNNIDMKQIKYITRENKKTCIYLADDVKIETYITVKDFLEILSPYDFICINKGTIVDKKFIQYIDGFTYHMFDGAQFEGRKRTAAAHKRLNDILHQPTSELLSTADILNQFSMLDDMPAAFCVIELVFNDDGAGIDFIFRYCNKEMEVVEGKSIDEMLGKSFYRVFPNADRKWLAAYTDVAVNGANRSLRDYSPEIGKWLSISCFQPIEGFCACLIIPID